MVDAATRDLISWETKCPRLRVLEAKSSGAADEGSAKYWLLGGRAVADDRPTDAVRNCVHGGKAGRDDSERQAIIGLVMLLPGVECAAVYGTGGSCLFLSENGVWLALALRGFLICGPGLYYGR